MARERCLNVSAYIRYNPEGVRHIGAASVITFRAFEPLVRAVAKAQPHEPAEVHAPQAGVGLTGLREGQLPNSLATVAKLFGQVL